MAIVGLLAIFGLQYVWLVNTYKLAKESIQFRSNEVFKDASMQELFHRMEELKAELKKKYAVQDTIVGVKVELDNDHDVAESGILNDNANQWLMSNMYVSIQEAVVKKYEVSVSWQIWILSIGRTCLWKVLMQRWFVVLLILREIFSRAPERYG